MEVPSIYKAYIRLTTWTNSLIMVANMWVSKHRAPRPRLSGVWPCSISGHKNTMKSCFCSPHFWTNPDAEFHRHPTIVRSQERVLDFLFVDFESMWGNSAGGSNSSKVASGTDRVAQFPVTSKHAMFLDILWHIKKKRNTSLRRQWCLVRVALVRYNPTWRCLTVTLLTLLYVIQNV